MWKLKQLEEHSKGKDTQAQDAKSADAKSTDGSDITIGHVNRLIHAQIEKYLVKLPWNMTI
jgi:hypothetical protein